MKGPYDVTRLQWGLIVGCVIAVCGLALAGMWMWDKLRLKRDARKDR